MNNLMDLYLENNLVLIKGHVGNGLVPFALNLIKDRFESISTTIYSFDGESDWYVNQLITIVSGLNRYDVNRYFSPCSGYKSKFNEDFRINELKYVSTIRRLAKSGTLIYYTPKDTYEDLSEDIPSLVKDNDLRLVIINNIEKLFSNSNINLQVGLESLKNLALTYNITFIILSTTPYESKKDKFEDNKYLRVFDAVTKIQKTSLNDDFATIEAATYLKDKKINMNINYNLKNLTMEEICK